MGGSGSAVKSFGFLFVLGMAGVISAPVARGAPQWLAVKYADPRCATELSSNSTEEQLASADAKLYNPHAESSWGVEVSKHRPPVTTRREALLFNAGQSYRIADHSYFSAIDTVHEDHAERFFPEIGNHRFYFLISRIQRVVFADKSSSYMAYGVLQNAKREPLLWDLLRPHEEFRIPLAFLRLNEEPDSRN